MYINQHLSSQQNFQGSLKLKGSWPKCALEAFRNNKSLQKSLETHTIIAEMMKKQDSMFVFSNMYKLRISAQKDNPSLWDKIKYFFGFAPKASLSKHYHGDYGTELIIQKHLSKVLKDQLKLNV